MKSKQLKSYNIPTDEILMDSIDAKPVGLLAVLGIVGALFVIVKWSTAFGAIMLVFAIVCLAFLPGNIMIYFFREYLILYNRADRNQCVLIYYDEVASWYYSWTPSKDYLYIELVDGSVEKLEAFSRSLFEFKMRNFLKDKQKKVFK